MLEFIINLLAWLYVEFVIPVKTWWRSLGTQIFRFISPAYGDIKIILKPSKPADSVADCWREDSIWSLYFGKSGVDFECKVCIEKFDRVPTGPNHDPGYKLNIEQSCRVTIGPEGNGTVISSAGSGEFSLDLDMFAPSEVFTDGVLGEILPSWQ